MKVCSTCKLPKENFYPNANRSDGLQTYCVDCAKERSKRRYKEFSLEKKSEIKKRAEEKRIRNKQFLWDYLKEHPCIDCGKDDPIVLDCDHLRDKKQSLSVMVNNASSIEIIKEELSKCEVRCANCHRRKTAKDFGWYKNIVQ